MYTGTIQTCYHGGPSFKRDTHSGLTISVESGLASESVRMENERFFHSSSFAVAPQLTVVRLACIANGGPDILLIGMLSSKARRGESVWTPQPHSAPI
jgi:hypothetical protein